LDHVNGCISGLNDASEIVRNNGTAFTSANQCDVSIDYHLADKGLGTDIESITCSRGVNAMALTPS